MYILHLIYLALMFEEACLTCGKLSYKKEKNVHDDICESVCAVASICVSSELSVCFCMQVSLMSLMLTKLMTPINVIRSWHS